MIQQKTIFDHLNNLTQNSDTQYFDNLSDEDKKTYNVYMINRYLSMNVGWISVVNEIQQYSQQLKPGGIHRVYDEVLPKGKVYLKYIKPNKSEKYEQRLLDIIKKHYEVNNAHAKEYYDIYTSSAEYADSLSNIIDMYGGDEKELKSLKKKLHNSVKSAKNLHGKS